jgi:glycosyltransferase involved in cell wall biosynthesis
VDDGSTDNSLEICIQYADLDDRIKVIHQENKGLCGARNTTLRNATGDYIFFVDPDDYVDTSLVSDAIKAMEDTDADIALFGFNMMKGEKCTGGRVWNIDLNSDKLKMISGCIDGWEVWGRAYRSNLWEGLSFDPELRTCEDAYITGILMEKAKKVIALPKKYYYWQRAPHGSILQTRKANSYRDEFLSWQHSEEDNSNGLFKDICHQRSMIAAAKALLKNQKDKTLTKLQEENIRRYYKSHTDIPLSHAAIVYFKYRKDILASDVLGTVTDRTVKDSLKMYAVDSVQNFLSPDDKEKLKEFIISHSTKKLHFEYRILQHAIQHDNSFICKLVGMLFGLK